MLEIGYSTLSLKKQYNTCVFRESSKLSDFKPLTKRGTERKFLFVLHHNLSSFILDIFVEKNWANLFGNEGDSASKGYGSDREQGKNWWWCRDGGKNGFGEEENV